MFHHTHSRRGAALGLSFVVAIATLMVISMAPTADAQPTASAAVAITTATPTLTTSPTPTSTPVPGTPQATDIVCDPTLTADVDRVELLDVVTFTFDDGCVCAGDFDCDFHPWSATLSSGGVALVDQFGRPPPTTFDARAVNAGLLNVTVDYFGEKQVGSLYFTDYLRASTVVEVGPQAGPSPTPTPGPAADAVVDAAPVTPTLTCSANAGVITWNDLNQPKYWVYVSTPANPTYSWLGRTLGATTFINPYPVVGATYQIRYAGAPEYYDCTTIAEPVNPTPPFSCVASNGLLEWVDHDQTKYWIYRSIDGGETYTWLGRTFGTTTFTDQSLMADARYQVHYEGIPRIDCESDNGDIAYLQLTFAEPPGGDGFAGADGITVTVRGKRTHTASGARANLPGRPYTVGVPGTCEDLLESWPDAFNCEEYSNVWTSPDYRQPPLAYVENYTDELIEVPSVEFYVLAVAVESGGCSWHAGSGLIPANQAAVALGEFGLACP